MQKQFLKHEKVYNKDQCMLSISQPHFIFQVKHLRNCNQ